MSNSEQLFQDYGSRSRIPAAPDRTGPSHTARRPSETFRRPARRYRHSKNHRFGSERVDGALRGLNGLQKDGFDSTEPGRSRRWTAEGSDDSQAYASTRKLWKRGQRPRPTTRTVRGGFRVSVRAAAGLLLCGFPMPQKSPSTSLLPRE